jgi:pyruvyl transferase EpsO
VASCALLGYPNHRNPGDHAIWLGAKRILRELKIEIKYECDWQTYSRESLARAVDAGATILFTGGGNFGDLWPNTQGLRERVLADFAGTRTVQLPQSIEFESDQSRERMRVLLERHGNVELMVRDSESLERARRWFAVPTRLVPDLAFALSRPKGADEPTVPILWVARRDKESLGFDPPPGAADIELLDWMPLRQEEAEQGGPHSSPSIVELLRRNTLLTRSAARGEQFDPAALAKLWERLSRERLALACSVLRRGRVIVTDRLHVHVMALHMGLPTVVSDNSYGKVRALYDTYTCSAPLARWASSPADALEIANELLSGAQLGPA